MAPGQWLRGAIQARPEAPRQRRREDAVARPGRLGNTVEPTWPEADWIVGKPPLWAEAHANRVGDAYVDDLSASIGSRPRERTS